MSSFVIFPERSGGADGYPHSLCRLVMYFGSVKFFKHIILAVVFGWIGVATVLAVFFAVRCHMLTTEAENAQTGVADTATVAEHVEMMKNAGYTSADIMEYIRANDPETFAAYIPEEGQPAQPAQLPVQVTKEPEQTSAVTQTEPVPGEDTADPANVSEDVPDSENSSDYTKLFPQMYAQKAADRVRPGEKTVFLTFDDGPSAGTYDILYILQKHGIKATFFMSAGKTEQCAEQMAAVAEGGHSIGVHSFSHDPTAIYSSVEAFLTDFYDTYKMISDATGVRPDIYRLPEIPEGTDMNIISEIRREMDRRGFTEFPANASSGDRDKDKSWQYIYDTSVASVTAAEGAAVLHLHDSADDYLTVLTVEDIIEYLEGEGYTFAPLDNSVLTD